MVLNKTIVITGAGGHLCGEFVRHLSHSNLVIAVDKRIHKVEKIIQELNSTTIVPYQMDVTIKDSWITLLNYVSSNFENIDVLINGAGTNTSTPFFDITLDEWQSVIDSQLTSTFLGCQVFGEYMVNQKFGNIINISSASSNPPLSKAFPYSVAKSGIVNLTKNLAREWATDGVRVNALRPGFFPTQWNIDNFITEERERDILNHTPMKRFGEPKELLSGIDFLLSDKSTFVTGTELHIDGGFSCQTI